MRWAIRWYSDHGNKETAAASTSMVLHGFAIVNMVLFHFLYDFFIIYQKDPKWYGKPLVGFWQQMICWTFIFISGMTWRLGKKKIKRGLLLNFWGLVITAITWLAMPQQTVWFRI